jgi:hypothetical protein
MVLLVDLFSQSMAIKSVIIMIWEYTKIFSMLKKVLLSNKLQELFLLIFLSGLKMMDLDGYPRELREISEVQLLM